MAKQDSQAWLETKSEQARARQELRAADQLAELPAAVLPMATDTLGVVPRALLWSALFAARARGTRDFLRNQRLAAQGGIELKFTGERLDQQDLDLWLALLRLAQGAPLGAPLRLQGAQVVGELGLTDSSSSRTRVEGGLGARDRVEAGLRRLVEGMVDVRGPDGEVFLGHLVESARRGRHGGAWSVTLSRSLVALFDDGVVKVGLAVRRELRGRPLALWLQAFTESHGGRPHAVRLYGDSAYASQKELIASKAPKAQDFTNQRTRRAGGGVDEVARGKNRNKSKIRARVEHVFGVVKRLWGFAKVRYRGLQKNATRAFTALALANIYLSRHRLMAQVRP